MNYRRYPAATGRLRFQLFLFLLFPACLSAAQIQGKVVDPSGAPVPAADVAVVGRLGVESQTITTAAGVFELPAPNGAGAHLLVTAPGFRTATLDIASGLTVQLEIAPQVDAVRVVGSAIDVPASEQGGSVSLVTAEQVRQRNQPFAFDLMRYLPGVALNQTGAPGGVATLFLRGGYSDFSLVQIDGVPVNVFGGTFDFAHIPAEAIDHIEVIRGPQSAVYGPYANSGVIDFVTRRPGPEPELDLFAEGGTYHEHRFGITATGTLAGFGVAASASRFDADGPVQNSDYSNENVMLNVTRRFGRQNLALGAFYDANGGGNPGPWGSDPAHTFTGIDTVSREKNNFSDYYAHYDADLSTRVREELMGGFFLENSGYNAPFGFSFGKDLRGQGEARTILSLSPHYVAAIGVSAGREEAKSTYITDANFDTFPVRRNDLAVYLENRFQVSGRLFINAGLRGEWIRTSSIPTDGFSRPSFPATTVAQANPKIAAVFTAAPATRLHASFGTGIRPPTSFELAFTDNPALKPEHTRSVDAGIEQKLAGGRLLLDATYFYNRFYDLIVTLGGSLTALSHYQSANLANSRAQGVEFSGTLRPARWTMVTASYTWLGTRILSLDGSSGLAPAYFKVGQQLTRRPEDSGSVVATFTRGRVTADATGYFRGRTLYEEPSYGASEGLFWDHGYANVGLNVNCELARGVAAYGSLRNALNQHYEEVFGFPSPRLNFVAGLKWKLARRR